MAQIIMALLIIAAFVVAVKVAIILLILAGLIFRTRETISLLVCLAAYHFFFQYPVISCGLIAFSAFVLIKAKKKEAAAERSPPLLTDEAGS